MREAGIFVQRLAAGNMPESEPEDSSIVFPLRHVLEIWATMTDPNMAIPAGWLRLQENRQGGFSPDISPAVILDATYWSLAIVGLLE